MNFFSSKIVAAFPPRRVLLLSISTILLFTSLYLVQVHRINGQFGFPLDDSWIHVRVAQNFIDGDGFGLNRGAPASVSTEPLWTLLLASAMFLFRDPIVSANLLGVILTALTSVFTYKLALLVTEDDLSATFAAVIPAFIPPFTWGGLAGMGVPLFVLLTLMGIYFHLLYRWRGDKSQYAPTFLFGLAALARPECFLLIGFSTVHFLAHSFFVEKTTYRSLLKNVALHLLLFLVVTSPFFLFNLATSGHLFPNTYYAKNIFWAKLNEINSVAKDPFDSFISWLSYYVYIFVDYGERTGWVPLLLLPFGVFAVYSSGRRREDERMRPGIFLLVALVYPFVLSWQNARIFGGGHVYGVQGRYFTNVFVLWGLIGAFAVASKKSDNFHKRLKLLIVLLTLFVMGFKQWGNSLVFAKNVKNVNEMNVAAARWVNQNTPSDAKIAVNDVGAIAYFSNREIIDVLGLVKPEAWPYIQDGQRGIFNYVKETRPDYLIVFPKWFPLMVQQTVYFQPVHSIAIPDNTILGSELMVIYKCSFPVDAPPAS